MRKIILGLAVSLDGFIEGPKGEYDWCFTDQDYGMSAFMKSIDGILMGRKSYEAASAHEGENPWGNIKTYVFSNTLTQVSGNTEIIRGDTIKSIEKLQKTDGKNLWLFGGAELTGYFINNDLVDELWLSVHPILLGAGKPLFQNLKERKKLELLNQQTYDTGLVQLLYRMK